MYVLAQFRMTEKVVNYHYYLVKVVHTPNVTAYCSYTVVHIYFPPNIGVSLLWAAHTDSKNVLLTILKAILWLFKWFRFYYVFDKLLSCDFERNIIFLYVCLTMYFSVLYILYFCLLLLHSLLYTNVRFSVKQLKLSRKPSKWYQKSNPGSVLNSVYIYGKEQKKLNVK